MNTTPKQIEDAVFRGMIKAGFWLIVGSLCVVGLVIVVATYW